MNEATHKFQTGKPSDWTTGVRFLTGTGTFTIRHRVQTGSDSRSASYPMGKGGGDLCRG